MPMMGGAVKENKPDNSGATQAAFSIIERYGGRRGRQALTAAAAAQVTAPAAKWAWGRLHREKEFTVTINGEDGIYGDVHRWVLERLPQDERQALVVATTTTRREEDVPALQLFYDGSRVQQVVIDGHKVSVQVEKEAPGLSVSPAEQRRHFYEKIIFTATTAAGRDSVIQVIDGLVSAKSGDQRRPLMVPTRWGGEWRRRGDLPERTLDSVVLKDGQVEHLVDDLSRFLASEDRYTRFYQPWHRGYLFHGLPGTGKTSVARALANHFDMAIYYLPLGDLEADADLMSLVSGVQPGSMLLLEDVDVYHAATERDDTKGRTSVAALLNALDGIWTPHGLVTVLTTNNKDALDDALVREGRIDVDEEFTGLDASQVLRLADWLGVESVDTDRYLGQSPAVLIEDLRNNDRQEMPV